MRLMFVCRVVFLALLGGALFSCGDSGSGEKNGDDIEAHQPSDSSGDMIGLHDVTPDVIRAQSDGAQGAGESLSSMDALEGADAPPANLDTGAQAVDSTTAPSSPPNILLIISDDLGVGASRCYDIGEDLAPTPNIESLCERGIVFDNMWSAPICSPTRANLLTGRFSYRTGIGDVVKPGHPGLSLDEWAIPRVLNANPQLGYGHACIGKWHVGPAGNKTHPNDMGYDHFSGLMIGAVPSYTNWNETTDGETENITQYATSRHIDQALSWLGTQQGPWFLWLALVAPHNPVHLPPANLHSYTELSGTEEDIEANGPSYYRAMIEAMDTEIGRLFEGIGAEEMENTVVIYVGDNGPSQNVTEAPYKPSRSKGSLYQGGVHVPMVIAGPGVKGAPGRTPALAHMVDLYATILDAAGANSSTIPVDVEIDGVSLWPVLDGSKTSVREWMMTEIFGETNPNKAGKAARDERYKLINLESGAQRFFDLEIDPYEESQLDLNNLEPDVLLRYQSLRDILEGVPAN